MEELLYWCHETVRSLTLKRGSIGGNAEEQRVRSGVRGAVDQARRS